MRWQSLCGTQRTALFSLHGQIEAGPLRQNIGRWHSGADAAQRPARFFGGPERRAYPTAQGAGAEAKCWRARFPNASRRATAWKSGSLSLWPPVQLQD